MTPSCKTIAYPRFSFRAEYSEEDSEERRELLLAADSPIQLSEWLNYINQHIQDYGENTTLGKEKGTVKLVSQQEGVI